MRASQQITQHCLTACAFGHILLLGLSGCIIVPVRLTTQTKDLSGTAQKLDFAFLKERSTTRDEVNRALAEIDTHADQGGFFWGRWESSKWGLGGGAIGPGFLDIAGSRIWGARNIFISFDEKGTVASWTVVDDKKLFHQLNLMKDGGSSSAESIRVTRKVELHNHRGQGGVSTTNLVLSDRVFELDDIKTTLNNIRRISPALDPRDPPHADHIWITVQFVNSTQRKHGIKSLKMGMDPSTFLLLRRNLRRNSSVLLPSTMTVTGRYKPFAEGRDDQKAASSPRLHAVTFWTTPNGGGGGINPAIHSPLRTICPFPVRREA